MLQIFVRRVEWMVDLERAAAFAEFAGKESVALCIDAEDLV